jgi:phage baseplate assembly protein W|tara:strand:- start:1441 stop:1848 length:408 start_codon:yes stop_codon:yes gene_type:complete
MAFGAREIAPIDTKPGTGVGVSIPFNAPGVFTTTYTTQKATQSNLINFLLTNNNERYLNPTFGGNIRAFVFEQIANDNIEGLQEDLNELIALYFPNIQVKKLIVNSHPDTNSINIEMTYNILGTGMTDDLQLEFN